MLYVVISQLKKKTLQNCLDTFVLSDTAVIAVSVINLTSLVQLTISFFSLVLSQLPLCALFY